MHIKTKQKWLHQHPLTLWLKEIQIAVFSQLKEVHLLELTASKEHTADGHDGKRVGSGLLQNLS